MPVISVCQLGKQFRLGVKMHNTLRDQLAGLFRGREENSDETFWALKDVNFSVEEGDVVGIVGRNGAGKSTLLKVLSQITDPTEGEVRIRGRVASLLEVGTGFHPELSGRENVFLNGAILGMSRREIRSKFDEIVAFAEVEKFIDTPVKHYSSGMYVRLAFAVAAHLEPEILIVDEVLAVGDGAFQRKCLGKMGEVSKGGRTILFVSHNLTAVRSLCRSAILLERGRVASAGATEDVLNDYLQKSEGGLASEWSAPEEDAADGIRLVRARVVPRGEGGVLETSAPVEFEFDVANDRAGATLNLSVAFQTEDDVTAFATVSERAALPAGLTRMVCFLPANFLNALHYRVSVKVVECGRVLDEKNDVLRFDVADGVTDRSWFGKWPGAVRPFFGWKIEPESKTS